MEWKILIELMDYQLREAPKFEDLSTSTEALLPVLVIDLIEPYAKEENWTLWWRRCWKNSIDSRTYQ